MVSAIAETVGTIGAAAIGANAANDASNQQAKSIIQAQGISSEAAEQARADILGTFDPAFRDISAGVRGSIDQLTSGRQSAADIISGFTQQGIDTRRRGEQAANLALQGTSQIGNIPGVDPNVSRIGDVPGVGPNVSRIGDVASAEDFLTQGGIQAQNILGQGIQSGVSEIEQFAGTGEQALEQEAALSGAFGPEAQQQAQTSFNESPGQKFLRERQEQSLLRNQAAIGGLGGGNVRTALQEQAFGIASTDQQRYLENLRSIATRGQQAAGQQAGIQVQGGITGSGLAQQQSQAQQQQAQMEVQSRRNQAFSQAQLNQQRAISETGALRGQALSQAQLNQQRAISEAGALRGQALSQAQLDQQRAFGLSGIAERSTAAQAGFLQGAGQQALTADQQANANIANLISGGAQNMANLRTGVGTGLANIALGQGSQQANLQQSLGTAQAAGTLGQNTAFQQGISGLGTIAGQRL